MHKWNATFICSKHIFHTKPQKFCPRNRLLHTVPNQQMEYKNQVYKYHWIYHQICLSVAIGKTAFVFSNVCRCFFVNIYKMHTKPCGILITLGRKSVWCNENHGAKNGVYFVLTFSMWSTSALLPNSQNDRERGSNIFCSVARMWENMVNMNRHTERGQRWPLLSVRFS